MAVCTRFPWTPPVPTLNLVKTRSAALPKIGGKQNQSQRRQRNMLFARTSPCHKAQQEISPLSRVSRVAKGALANATAAAVVWMRYERPTTNFSSAAFSPPSHWATSERINDGSGGGGDGNCCHSIHSGSGRPDGGQGEGERERARR